MQGIARKRPNGYPFTKLNGSSLLSGVRRWVGLRERRRRLSLRADGLGCCRMRLDGLFGGDGGKGASQAYWNAFNKLRDAWREVFDDELEKNGSRGMEAYENALSFIKRKLRDDATGERALRTVLDVAPEDDIGKALLGADLDDIPPKIIKQSIRDQVDKKREQGRIRISLRPLLRAALDTLFDGTSSRRPNVGPNRHWYRLHQYLRELEDETDWSPDGRGFRLANAGGRGPVAQFPRDPGRLDVIIDPEFLWPKPKGA